MDQLDAAIEHHRAGRLSEAEAAYRAVLQAAPNLVDAQHGLGLVYADLAQFHDAAAAFEAVLRLRPDDGVAMADLSFALNALDRTAEADHWLKMAASIQPNLAGRLNDIGVQSRRRSQLQDAKRRFRQALAINPDLAEAHINLGLTFRQTGEIDQAIAALKTALQINPLSAEAHANLGLALRDKGQFEEAIAAYDEALRLKPRLFEAHDYKAAAHLRLGQFDQAEATYREALAIQPDSARALAGLGSALLSLNRPAEASEYLQKAALIAPQDPAYLDLSGVALTRTGRLTEAEQTLRRAIQLDPAFADAHRSLGKALKAQGRIDDALDCFGEAEAVLDRQARAGARTAEDEAKRSRLIANLHVDRGEALLLRGDLAAGWREYEWRDRLGQIWRPDGDAPKWTGEALPGEPILLYCEQGLGDAIQFARFVPSAAARVGAVVLRCPQALAGLFAGVEGVASIATDEQPGGRVAAMASLMSLPFLLGADTIPAKSPYLRADTGAVTAWRARLPAANPIKVGLCWRGNPRQMNDHNRSMSAADFARFTDLPGVDFIGLQVDASPAEWSELGLTAEFASQLSDMVQTAALIASLDLVITVDTAVCHLAGALGAPTWALITYAPDWRWMLNRTDSPWYPSLRLYRQTAPNDWGPALAAVRHDLQALSLARAG